MALFGVTESSAVALALVSQYVQTLLTEKSILLPSILDRSADVEVGAKSISIGRSTKFTAESKSENSAYTSQVLTWSADALLLDKQEGVYVEAEKIALIQSAISQESEILKAASLALIEKLEGNIYTALAAVSASAPDHKIAFDSSTTLQVADIAEAAQLLDVQKVPMADRFLAVHPTQYWQICGSSAFTEAAKYGSNSALVNGEVGKILGFTVLKTTSVTENTVLAYHREHVAFARQLAINWDSAKKLSNSAVEYLLETIYGLKTLDSGKRGVLINATGS